MSKENIQEDPNAEEHSNVPVTDSTLKLSKRTRLRNLLYSVAAVMIGFGSWNDTKELSISIYQDIISNFTHNVEYEALSQLDVGMSREYVDDLVGKAKVIKPSRYIPSIRFEYIFDPKYLLILQLEDDRLIGFAVASLVDDFSAEIPFSKHSLNTEPLGAMTLPPTHSYLEDNVNVTYYIENHELGRQGLFLFRSVGFISYGAKVPATEMKAFQQIQLGSVEGDDDKVYDAVMFLRESLPVNFYGVSETTPDIMAESLLTKFEFEQFK